MAERYTLARPYAKAVCELAEAQGASGFAAWSDALAALSAIVRDDAFQAVMHNPRVDRVTLVDAIIAVGDADMGDEARNLVRLLGENDRLSLAPEIAELFEAERSAMEDRLEVEVTSATELTQAQQQALGKALEKRFGRTITMHFAQDDSIIGGAVIRADDVVIDGSLTSQLARMRRSLAH